MHMHIHCNHYHYLPHRINGFLQPVSNGFYWSVLQSGFLVKKGIQHAAEC